MQEVYRVIARVVSNDLTVLVSGESGTGKELVARAIHDLGRRRSGPFVAINMAAIPRELIEAELFGHERGAFTGAQARNQGRFEQAAGGTLFLDEIGDMPVSSQTRLLRVLAEREVLPIGGTRPHAVDMRVIAATHRDLLAMVKSGAFREDLYFRLNGAVITLPPLRERSDLAALVARLLESRAFPDGTPRTISANALGILSSHSWPGNIRELVNVIDFACAVASNPEIAVDDLPDEVFRRSRDDAASVSDEDAGREGHQAAALREDLRRAGWNISAAARLMGVDRTTLHRRMRKLGVTLPPRMPQ
jgi:DNA-binding NtrC family response regulator